METGYYKCKDEDCKCWYYYSSTENHIGVWRHKEDCMELFDLDNFMLLVDEGVLVPFSLPGTEEKKMPKTEDDSPLNRIADSLEKIEQWISMFNQSGFPVYDSEKYVSKVKEKL